MFVLRFFLHLILAIQLLLTSLLGLTAGLPGLMLYMVTLGLFYSKQEYLLGALLLLILTTILTWYYYFQVTKSIRERKTGIFVFAVFNICYLVSSLASTFYLVKTNSDPEVFYGTAIFLFFVSALSMFISVVNVRYNKNHPVPQMASEENIAKAN